MRPEELIDLYIAEIGRDLPRKTRKDIEAEIRSAIEDMLTERREKGKGPVDEEMVMGVLKEYGAPRKVAASYLPERYLVGPRLFQSFLTVIQVVLPIIAGLSLVQLFIALGQAELTFENVFEAVFLDIAGFFGTAFTALGAILVLFAIVQWTLPEFKEKTGDWDPRRMREANPRNRIDTGGTLLEIFGAGLAIAIFNFFPQMINVGYYPDGSWWIAFLGSTNGSAWSTTLLSQAFFGYLPALSILWSLTILSDIALLSRGRWENWSRWTSFGLQVMTIALAGFMLAGPSLVDVSAEALLAAGFPDPLAVRVFINLAGQGTILALAITILFNLIKAIRLVVRLTGTNLSPKLEKFAHP